MEKANCSLVEAVRKAAACGMTYGKWVEADCPEPQKDFAKVKTECKRQSHRKGKSDSTQ